MTDDTSASLPATRVAARPGVGGVAETRRRIYQRHLLLIAAVAAGLIGLDLYTSPGVQWAHFPLVPWALIFLLHSAGLKSRGYSFVEMFIPPRQVPVKEVYTVPLDYEVVRARQLRDGIVNAAAAVRNDDAQLADDAVASADALLEAVERAVARTRAGGAPNGDSNKLDPELKATLEAFHQLHQQLIQVEVMDASADRSAIEAARERAETLRKLTPAN